MPGWSPPGKQKSPSLKKMMTKMMTMMMMMMIEVNKMLPTRETPSSKRMLTMSMMMGHRLSEF